MSFDLSKLADTYIGVGSITVSDVFFAILTLAICIVAIRILTRLSARLLSRGSLDPRVQKYIVRGLKIVAWIIAILLIIESLGITPTSLVALLSICSLGITLAAEDILGNMAGGLVVLSSHLFSIGDFIETDGVSGTVEEITLNHTKLYTLDGQVVVIPNRALAAGKMTNYSTLGRRRVFVKVTASYDAPTDAVKGACRAALAQTPNILDDPAPSVYLSDYGSSSIEYSIFCWAAVEEYWNVYFALRENLRSSFAQAGVEMTYEHLNVHMIEDKKQKS